MKRLFNILVLAAVVFGAYRGLEVLRRKKAEVPKAEVVRPVKTVTLTGGGTGGIWRYYGTLQGGRRVELSFRVSGPLKEVLVDRGAPVKKGDLLATLDPRDFQTLLRQAQSNQSQAQAQFKDAEANFRRYENLYKQQVVPKATYDTYKTQVDVARSALNAAAAQTASMRDSLKDTELRAPFDGVIADRMVENFEDVTAKQPIVSLQDISTLEIVFNVPDNDVIWASRTTGRASSAQSRATIQARFDAIPDRAFPLKVKEFVIQADPNTNTFPITATMPRQEDVALLPGMAAAVEVVIAPDESEAEEGEASFLVPATALIGDGRGSAGGERGGSVWRYEDGQVRSVPVTAGAPHDDGSVEISGPMLRNGDQIVVAGANLLREGQRVRLMPRGQ